MRRALLAVVLVLSVAGCGGDGEPQATDTGTTTAPAGTTQLRVYWLRDGKVWPALREVAETEAVAKAALEALLAGPTEQEETELGFSTAIPADTELESIEISDGVARVEPSAELPGVACPGRLYGEPVSDCRVGGDPGRSRHPRRLRGLDARDPRRVPALVREGVEPSAGDRHRQHVRGDVQLRAHRHGRSDRRRELRHGHLGNGDAGDVRVHDRPFTVPFDGVGSLIVFELSAKDGSRINLVEIPIRMTR